MEINFLAMGQTQKYAGVKPVNGIPTLLVLIEAHISRQYLCVFVCFSNKVFCQIVGIPLGTNCASIRTKRVGIPLTGLTPAYFCVCPIARKLISISTYRGMMVFNDLR
jgi:hypothetical protein